MGKSRKIDVMKKINVTASETLPVVDRGLQTVGTTAKDVAQSSIPIIEKGVSGVYGTMASGLDLGVQGVKTVSKGLRRSSRSISRGRSSRLSRGRSSRLSRGRKMAGGARRRSRRRK
jgi:hypothetical protein